MATTGFDDGVCDVAGIHDVKKVRDIRGVYGARGVNVQHSSSAPSSSSHGSSSHGSSAQSNWGSISTDPYVPALAKHFHLFIEGGHVLADDGLLRTFVEQVQSSYEQRCHISYGTTAGETADVLDDCARSDGWIQILRVDSASSPGASDESLPVLSAPGPSSRTSPTCQPPTFSLFIGASDDVNDDVSGDVSGDGSHGGDGAAAGDFGAGAGDPDEGRRCDEAYWCSAEADIASSRCVMAVVSWIDGHVAGMSASSLEEAEVCESHSLIDYGKQENRDVFPVSSRTLYEQWWKKVEAESIRTGGERLRAIRDAAYEDCQAAIEWLAATPSDAGMGLEERIELCQEELCSRYPLFFTDVPGTLDSDAPGALNPGRRQIDERAAERPLFGSSTWSASSVWSVVCSWLRGGGARADRERDALLAQVLQRWQQQLVQNYVALAGKLVSEEGADVVMGLRYRALKSLSHTGTGVMGTP